ncbi:Poly(A) polymerase I [Bienertia sinuspersici]
MAVTISKLSILCKPISPIRPFFYCRLLPLNSLSLILRWSSAAAIDIVDETEFIIKPSKPNFSGGGIEVREWKKLNSKELGISTSKISEPIRVVLKNLKKNGYEVYLVGGCVRDLVLKRIPKDFDILTSAELRQVQRTFPHCEIVGRRFPICHVHVGRHVVEVCHKNSHQFMLSKIFAIYLAFLDLVSSFSTGQHNYHRNPSFAASGPIHCNGKDKVRWRNCMQRDFTVNGLMFDPFARLLQTVIPASISFHEDCARILRAIRIAARSGFSLARETAQSVRNLSYLILRLHKGRILMEMNYMLAYGSAEASLRLLWKYGLLELLLPLQAAYFVRSGFRRRDTGSNMLLTMFANLDKLLAPDRPCHNSLWVTILAFHKALSDHARDPSVIAAFALAVNNGGDITEALKPRNLEQTVLREEVLSLAASVHHALSDMTDVNVVSKAMVFISLGLYMRAHTIVKCVVKGKEMGFLSKQGCKIDYEMLAIGSLQEVRHIFARVVFDTVYPLTLLEDHTNT